MNRIETALKLVSPEAFVPPEASELPGADMPVILKRLHGLPVVSFSQPSLVKALLALADLRIGQSVLEIGTGSGYLTALIAHLIGPSGHLISFEIDGDSAHAANRRLRDQKLDAQIIVGDGTTDPRRPATFDVIIATASVSEIPDAWATTLKTGGWLIAPVWFKGAPCLGKFVKEGPSLITSSEFIAGSFMPIRHAPASPGPYSSGSSVKELNISPFLGKEGDSLLASDHIQQERSGLDAMLQFPDGLWLAENTSGFLHRFNRTQTHLRQITMLISEDKSALISWVAGATVVRAYGEAAGTFLTEVDKLLADIPRTCSLSWHVDAKRFEYLAGQ